MLIELRIHNVAVIDAVVLPLTAGFNVLSGETGAGKSLIVGALGLLLGERATADRVRADADRASVEGVFAVSNDAVGVHNALAERGIDADDDVLILKREIQAGGRSRAWINGSPVTATMLAEIGAMLVSVHGQHDSRQLLEPEVQGDILDAFARATDVRVRVANAHDACLRLAREERTLRERQAAARRQADYLRFVQREIADAHLVAGEADALELDVRRLSSATDLREQSAGIAAALDGHDEASLAQLADVRRHLVTLARIDPTTERWQEMFDAAFYALEELAREVEAYAEAIDADPAKLASLQSRQELIATLLRKHGPTLDDVIAAGESARQQLELVDDGDRELHTLVDARRLADTALASAAHELTQLRADGANRLGTMVSTLLPDLGMPDGRFDVALNPLDAVGARGAESIVFLAALNVGSDARPLHRIASGGELSRVMLALSTVLARLQQVPTLVFDEVDAGIGGEIAWQVGALMQRVASHHQVLAISHLAQIAARAHHHVVVRKSAVGTVTTADTEVVDGEARIVEIARMLGGDAEREVSRAHARELLLRGQTVADDGATSTRSAPPTAAPTASSPARRSAQRRG